MIRDPLEEKIFSEYVDWMYDLVCNDRYSRRLSYRTLFSYLNETPFEYTIPMDGNRAEDGTDLRYRFGRENGYSDQTIATYLDVEPCSVLEMMIALAFRIEDQIMWNPDVGDRTGQWFWEMIVNLGLGQMHDGNFDLHEFHKIMNRLIDRKYKRNGEGGLFKISDRSIDMRTTEIWYQMQYYLGEVLDD